jgi:hypothetical protein
MGEMPHDDYAKQASGGGHGEHGGDEYEEADLPSRGERGEEAVRSVLDGMIISRRLAGTLYFKKIAWYVNAMCGWRWRFLYRYSYFLDFLGVGCGGGCRV